MAYSTTLTEDEARTFADIYISLLMQLGPFASVAVWHVGERHADDAPALAADDVTGWLLSLPQQADRKVIDATR